MSMGITSDPEVFQQPYLLGWKACWCRHISFINLTEIQGASLGQALCDLSVMILLMPISTRLPYASTWSFSSQMGWLVAHCQSMLVLAEARLVGVSYVSNWMVLLVLLVGYSFLWLHNDCRVVWGTKWCKFSQVENWSLLLLRLRRP